MFIVALSARAKHYPFRKFTNLPPSPIKFDADRPADFFNKNIAKMSDLGEMSLTYRACYLYSKDIAFNKIKRELGVHQQQLKRMIQKGLSWFVENYEDSKGDFGGEKCKQPETAPTEEITPKQASH